MKHEFDGKKYEAASKHQKEWGTKIIAELELQGHERVLDLGCGDGTLTARIAELLPRGKVIGIDASKSMIHTAQSRVRNNLLFILMDINNLAFSEQFDAVFSNATLHWVKDHRRLYENISRVLRPGGLIRFNFAADGNCSHFFKVIYETMARQEFAPYFAVFEWPWYMPAVQEYSELVESCGLVSTRVWGENADRFFPDEDTMIRWIDQPSLVPFLAQVPQQYKEAFRTFVVRMMIQATKQDDGRCFETFRRINVFGKKKQ